jgi:hypothetical protein
MATVFASSVQATVLADVIRKTKDPDAKSIVDPEKLADEILATFKNMLTKLRKEEGLNVGLSFDANVRALLLERPELTELQAQIEVSKAMQVQ